MQLGTDEEICEQAKKVEDAEAELCKARLRHRALTGAPLLQGNDSMPFAVMQEELKILEKEFGSRNLRMF